ncbi:MAG: periplasmic heavy metal sensor [Yoonia sp.]|uniref:periplasmic heavy metal sensor n=1 Tax=Yoonia sp. TaxID=2212373 RepID=UPI003EF7D558
MAEQTGKPSRLWRIVLVLSLALNLAVAGVVVGAVGSGKFGDRPPRSFDLGVGPISRALLPDERRQIRRSLRQQRVLHGTNPGERFTQMADILRADPFDQQALTQVLEQQSARMSQVQRGVQKALMDTIIAMTPERRAAFADALLAEPSIPRQRTPSGG